MTAAAALAFLCEPTKGRWRGSSGESGTPIEFPWGRRWVSPSGAHAGSVYCLRRDTYHVFDRQVSDSTRFFGAAAATVEYLANNDIPIVGNVLSDQAEAFLGNVSANLYSLNAAVFAQIQRGELSGDGLDEKLVHMEQSKVQAMLDALPGDERAAIVNSLNTAFNSSLRSVSNIASATDARYNRVISGVVRDLGRPIYFGNQSDREAIGHALIKDLRRSGACTTTGSRIPTC